MSGQKLSSSSYGNTVAKDIDAFIKSAETNGGYYIGRYEARDGTTTEARASRLNSSLATQGTSSTSYAGDADVQCNVYDMAGNVRERTTETYSDFSLPCVNRGGSCSYSLGYTSFRSHLGTTVSSNNIGFRPLLYLYA